MFCSAVWNVFKHNILFCERLSTKISYFVILWSNILLQNWNYFIGGTLNFAAFQGTSGEENVLVSTFNFPISNFQNTWTVLLSVTQKCRTDIETIALDISCTCIFFWNIYNAANRVSCSHLLQSSMHFSVFCNLAVDLDLTTNAPRCTRTGSSHWTQPLTFHTCKSQVPTKHCCAVFSRGCTAGGVSPTVERDEGHMQTWDKDSLQQMYMKRTKNSLASRVVEVWHLSVENYSWCHIFGGSGGPTSRTNFVPTSSRKRCGFVSLWKRTCGIILLLFGMCVRNLCRLAVRGGSAPKLIRN